MKDFLAGIFMLIEDQYGVGDIVDVGEAARGTVEAVTLRTTRLRDVNGTVWHVPNGQILRVGNKSQQWARALLDMAVAYGTDLDRGPGGHQAGRRRACGSDPDWAGQVLEEPEVWGVESLGARRRHDPAGREDAAGRAVQACCASCRGRIKAALDDAGVEIATAQRTLVMQRDPGAAGPPAPTTLASPTPAEVAGAGSVAPGRSSVPGPACPRGVRPRGRG